MSGLSGCQRTYCTSTRLLGHAHSYKLWLCSYTRFITEKDLFWLIISYLTIPRYHKALWSRFQHTYVTAPLSCLCKENSVTSKAQCQKFNLPLVKCQFLDFLARRFGRCAPYLQESTSPPCPFAANDSESSSCLVAFSTPLLQNPSD